MDYYVWDVEGKYRNSIRLEGRLKRVLRVILRYLDVIVRELGDIEVLSYYSGIIRLN